MLLYLFFFSYFFIQAEIIFKNCNTKYQSEIKKIIEESLLNKKFKIKEVCSKIKKIAKFDYVNIYYINDDITVDCSDFLHIQNVKFFIDNKPITSGQEYEMFSKIFDLENLHNLNKLILIENKISILQYVFSTNLIKNSTVSYELKDNCLTIKVNTEKIACSFHSDGSQNVPDLQKLFTDKMNNYFVFMETDYSAFNLHAHFPKVIEYANNFGYKDFYVEDFYVLKFNSVYHSFIYFKEGPKYSIKNYIFSYDNSNLIPCSLKFTLKTPFSINYINYLIYQIKDFYSKNAEHVEVDYCYNINDTNEVDINFSISRSAGFIISEIIILGCENELFYKYSSLSPGFFCNEFILEKEKQILLSSGFFESVDFLIEDDYLSGNKRLKAKLKLTPKGLFNFSFNYSPHYSGKHNINLTFSYSNSNFFYSGNSFNVNLNLGNFNQYFLVQYGIPKFMHSYFDVAFSIYSNISNFNQLNNNKKEYNSGQFTAPSASSVVYNKDLHSLPFVIFDTKKDVTSSSKLIGCNIAATHSINPFSEITLKLNMETKNVEYKSNSDSRFFKTIDHDGLLPSSTYFLTSLDVSYNLRKNFKKQLVSFSLKFSLKSNLFINIYSDIEIFCSYKYFFKNNANHYFKLFINGGIMPNLFGTFLWIDNFHSLPIKGLYNIGPIEIDSMYSIGGTYKLFGFAEFVSSLFIPDSWNIQFFVGIYSGSLWGGHYENKKITETSRLNNGYKDNIDDIFSKDFKLRFSVAAGIRFKIIPGMPIIFELGVARTANKVWSDIENSVIFNIYQETLD